MGFVLAQIAVKGSAEIEDFTDLALEDSRLRGLSGRMEMVFDPEVEAAYPKRWIGLVETETTEGVWITSRIDVPKGDPGNALTREEIEDKIRGLAFFGKAASDKEASRIIACVRAMEYEPDLRDLLPKSTW